VLIKKAVRGIELQTLLKLKTDHLFALETPTDYVKIMLTSIKRNGKTF